MADGATDLSDLLGSAPVQQAPAFNPITTGGGDPFIAPVAQVSTRGGSGPSMPNFSAIRYSVKNFMTYVGFFLATAILSLSTPRSLLLQYIPNTYTSGGVLSYSGAAVVGAASVVLAYVITTLFNIVL
jgi:hypothetical protein